MAKKQAIRLMRNPGQVNGMRGIQRASFVCDMLLKMLSYHIIDEQVG